jgi:hypothetical protein
MSRHLTWAVRLGPTITTRSRPLAHSTVRHARRGRQRLADSGLTTPLPSMGACCEPLAGQRNLSLSDTARLFAMSYAAFSDGFIGCMNAKYHFSFWRPVTAIQNGDIDGNPDTVADTTWLPLATTPNHPEYPAA